MKILDLDELVTQKDSIKFAGKQWTITRPITVGMMLKAMKFEQQSEGKAHVDRLEMLIDVLAEILGQSNKIDRVVFYDFSYEHLLKVYQFVLGSESSSKADEKKETTGAQVKP